MIRSLSRLLLSVTVLTAVAQPPSVEPKPVPMPPDRAADTYAIYSYLLPGDATGSDNAHPSFWLVEDRTITGMEDPRQAIKAPKGREADLEALAEDYDLHKIETIALTAQGYQAKLPIRMADKPTRDRFIATRGGVTLSHIHDADDLIGIAGMHSFSQVFFNQGYSLAIVYFGMYCHPTCGNSTWLVLKHRNGNWSKLSWVYSSSIS